jgi:hypothetical protein
MLSEASCRPAQNGPLGKRKLEIDLFQLRAENELRAAFRTLGAVTPATARPGKEMPRETPAFDRLLQRGVIREGAPGTFYLYEHVRAPGRWVRQVVFWIVVVILPVAIIQFCPRSP